MGAVRVFDNAQPNHVTPIFRENQFFVFFGPQKIFLSPQNLVWPQKPHFWGVILLKLFDLSNGFKVIDFKIAIFWPN